MKNPGQTHWTLLSSESLGIGLFKCLKKMGVCTLYLSFQLQHTNETMPPNRHRGGMLITAIVRYLSGPRRCDVGTVGPQPAEALEELLDLIEAEAAVPVEVGSGSSGTFY